MHDVVGAPARGARRACARWPRRSAGSPGAGRTRPARSASIAGPLAGLLPRSGAAPWWPSGTPPGPPACRNELRSAMVILSAMSPALPHATGPMPGRLAVADRPDHRGARAVGEDDAGGAVRPVDPRGQLLGADHQHVPGGARPDRVGWRWPARSRSRRRPRSGRRRRARRCRAGARPRRRRSGSAPRCVQVATMTRSMSAGDRPLRRPAPCRPLRRPCRPRLSSGPANRRLAMPTRLRIHSSLVSTVRGQVVVGDHVAGLVAAERQGCGRPRLGRERGTGGCHAPSPASGLHAGSHERLALADRVPVFHQPLDDAAA
mgnify:CR=1 FL=1